MKPVRECIGAYLYEGILTPDMMVVIRSRDYPKILSPLSVGFQLLARQRDDLADATVRDAVQALIRDLALMRQRTQAS